MSSHSRVFGGRGAHDASDPLSKAEEAELLSRATKAAVAAAKSILLTGGSEDMAIRTAKAAAFSVFCPNLSEADINSRKASSYLKRRHFKKQSGAVASVALVTAKAALSNYERDQTSSCERSTGKGKRSNPAHDPKKTSASSVASGKTGPTATTTGISTAGEQSTTHYVRIRQTDEPSAITNPTKFDEPSLFSDPSESKRPTSSFVQETREKIRRRNNPNPKTVQVEEHPMKLTMARTLKLETVESEEANWFENMTYMVNVAWAIFTCGNDCSPPADLSAVNATKDDRTLVTRTGMEIKCDDGKDQISTVTPCPEQQAQDTSSAEDKRRGSAAPGQYGSVHAESRDDEASYIDSYHADSLVERWSQSLLESEHSSIDESVSRLMHSFSSTESDEIQVRSALRETMERAVERSKHRRTIPIDDDEPFVYVISHKHVPEPKRSELSVRTRKLFASLKKNARKRLFEA